jgi:hypothetical protein
MVPMRFENKSKDLLPFSKFIQRVLKYAVYSLIMISVSVGIGVLGYWYFAKLSLTDAFYNACMILTGMGPVNNMATPSAKMFSSFYALFSGIAFLSTIAVFFAPIAHRFLHILHLDDDGDSV